MRKEILAVLPKHEEYMETLDGRDLYVVDWKDENNGGISFTDYHPGRAAVVLSNPAQISVCCDKFSENALPIKKGCFSRQCECVLFPLDDAGKDDNWVLFIETKYAKDEFKAKDVRNRYPETMVAQVEKTVLYFREKAILKPDKIVYAIVSFPMLENVNAWFDQNLIYDALVEHKIIVRATNHAEILNRQVLRL